MRGFWLSRWLNERPQQARAEMLSELITLIDGQRDTAPWKLFLDEFKLEDFSGALGYALAPKTPGKALIRLE